VRHVKKDMLPIESNAIEDLGVVNMGDGQALQNFVAWGRRNFPARRTMLVPVNFQTKAVVIDGGRILGVAQPMPFSTIRALEPVRTSLESRALVASAPPEIAVDHEVSLLVKITKDVTISDSQTPTRPSARRGSARLYRSPIFR
jgi:hypothetical protein